MLTETNNSDSREVNFPPSAQDGLFALCLLEDLPGDTDNVTFQWDHSETKEYKKSKFEVEEKSGQKGGEGTSCFLSWLHLTQDSRNGFGTLFYVHF